MLIRFLTTTTLSTELFLRLYFDAVDICKCHGIAFQNARITHGSICRYLTIWILLYYGRLKSALSFYNSLMHMCVSLHVWVRACVRLASYWNFEFSKCCYQNRIHFLCIHIVIILNDNMLRSFHELCSASSTAIDLYFILWNKTRRTTGAVDGMNELIWNYNRSEIFLLYCLTLLLFFHSFLKCVAWLLVPYMWSNKSSVWVSMYMVWS